MRIFIFIIPYHYMINSIVNISEIKHVDFFFKEFIQLSWVTNNISILIQLIPISFAVFMLSV